MSALELTFSIARQVRRLREAAGMSQTALARRVGTKQPAIARLEKGDSCPSIDLLRRVARALGVRLEVKFWGQP